MTIASVTSSTATTTTTSSSSTSLLENYEAFLTILVKQLEVQDPTDPVDTAEFTNQLFQVASLEQQIKNGSLLEDLSDQVSALGTSSAALGYMGRTITADGDTAPLQDGSATWEYELADTADSVTLTITDEDGTVVYETTGSIGKGEHSFTWDGVDEDGEQLADGLYTLTVTAADDDGNAIEVDTRIRAEVTGIDSSSGSTELVAGDLSVPVEDVLAVS